MEIEKILSTVDHTLLKQTATWDEIREILDDAIKYHTASVCIPPSYVKQAAEYVDIGEQIKIKAAGGIASFDDAEQFIRLGASRLGTSRLIKLRRQS